jgi:hypothetical protein
MLASGARTSSRTVLTGSVMIEDTGASGERPLASTFLRRSASVTMPRPLLLVTRMAVTTSSLMTWAA